MSAPAFTPGVRAFAELFVRTSTGAIPSVTTVVLYEEDGTTLFGSNVYSAKSGGSPLVTISTDNEGYVALYCDLADARPFKYLVTGDTRKINGFFSIDARDLVTLTQTQHPTGAKEFDTPTLNTPIFDGTATGFQTASIKNSAGATAVRLEGQTDVTVAGSWSATNGSPNITSAGNRTTDILRDQSVKITQSGQTLTVLSCLHSGGTTTVILSANYSGVTGSITLLKDQPEVLDLKNGAGNSWFRIDSNGNWYTYGTRNIQADHHQDSSDDDTWSNGVLMLDQAHRRIFIANSWFVTSIGDPADCVIRYAEGTGVPDASPTQVPADANIGALYWMAYHGTGWGLRSAAIHGWTTQTATSTHAGGRLEIRTTPNDTNEAKPRWDFWQDGAFRVKSADALAPLEFWEVLSLDGSDNLNIGRSDGITDIQTYGRWLFYDDATSPSLLLTIDPSLGVLLPDLASQTANYLTRRGILAARAKVTESGGTYTLVAGGYNIASINKTGTGVVDVVIGTDMANADYTIVVTPINAAARHPTITNIATTGFTVNMWDAGGSAAEAGFMLTVAGAQ